MPEDDGIQVDLSQITQADYPEKVTIRVDYTLKDEPSGVTMQLKSGTKVKPLRIEDNLLVFWTQVGDQPERIYLSQINLKGDWMDLQPFSKLTLNQASYNISTSDISTGGSESYVEQHNHFVVELVNPKDNSKLLLCPKNTYHLYRNTNEM